MNKNSDKINKIFVDLLVKSSRIDFLLNTLCDMNNAETPTDFDLSPEEYNKIQTLLVNTINELSSVVMKISNKYREDFNKYVKEQEQLQSTKGKDK